MATASLTATDNDVTVGDVVEVTYAVQGADDEPARIESVRVVGTAVVDGESLPAEVDVTITKPAVTHTKTYERPTAPGMTFQSTADPRVWRAVAALA